MSVTFIIVRMYVLCVLFLRSGHAHFNICLLNSAASECYIIVNYQTSNLTGRYLLFVDSIDKRYKTGLLW